MSAELEDAFDRTVEEGAERLHRRWPALLATGVAGGVDLGVGVVALLVVRHATGSALLGALAFGIGFVALTLVKSELFTENFLVPVAAVVTRRATVRSVLRLWAGTIVGNLVGGWVLMGIAAAGLPELSSAADEVASHYPDLGVGWTAFAAGLLGGAVITLLTWMDHATESVPAKLVAAVGTAFVLAAAPLNHAIVSSLEMFAALHYGTAFGYSDWAAAFAWGALANAVGGIGFVTVVRLGQVGPDKLREERRPAPASAAPPEEDGAPSGRHGPGRPAPAARRLGR